MSRSPSIVRNAAALIGSQPITWTLTLIFTVVVPRNVGPGEWGEWAIAWAVGNLAKALLDFGINTVLFKAVSRDPDRPERMVGAVLALRMLLTPALVLGMIGFSLLAGYTPHTRLVVALVAFSLALAYLAGPVVFGLQALEKMHLTAAGNVLSSLVLTAGSVALVKFFAFGIVSISIVAIVSQAAGLAIQWLWLSRIPPRERRLRPVLDWRLFARLLRDGLPYWATFGFFTLYVLADGIMLSLLGSTRENGWYGVAVQIIATLGFLPYAVTTAVFPALSRTMHSHSEESARIAARSFRLLVALSLPMTTGLALVAANLVSTLYGGWFAPAGAALTVLAITLPPVYIATIVNGFLIAADRQVQWTWVMGAMCAVNIPLNLLAIPYFHGHGGNGALGAALALLVTDFATGVAAIVLLPSGLRSAVVRTAPSIGRSAVATAGMGLVVWPLRELFLPIPVVAGGAAFVALAVVLRVFPAEDSRLLTALAVRLARRPLALFGRRPPAGPAGSPAGVEPDVEVA